MVESSIVIIDDRIVDYSRGLPCEVTFNWDRVWSAYKSLNKEYIPWFIHVHPKGCTEHSAQDLLCMQGFYLALKEEIYFSIIIFENDDINNLSYTQYDYIYWGDPHGEYLDKVKPGLIGTLSFGQTALLKSLSYGGNK